MAVQIQIRRGTAANWTSTNPTLAEGELGYETDTGKLKAGDGSTAWTGLGYVSGTGALSNVVEDDTPQLGGNLDVNGNAIVSTSNANIAITPDGTGVIVLDGFNWPSSDGTNGQVLKTNGSGTLSFGDASTVAALNDLTDVSVGSETNKDALIYRTGSGWINDAIAYTDVTNNVGSGAVDLPTRTDIAAGTITDVVALANDDYLDLLNNGTPDPNTLFVITNGTTSIADSDDVTITGTPADNSFLVYHTTSSAWIDRTATEARSDLGLGTLATQSTITDSYVGHIETPADGTYYLDPASAANRTITKLYLKWVDGGSGTGTLTLAVNDGVGDTTVDTVNLATASNPYTSAALSQLLADDEELKATIASLADVTDLRFVVEYTQ